MIEFHQTHKRHKDLINRGVCHNLSEYISALNAIDQALEFFEENQPECPEINQLGLGFSPAPFFSRVFSGSIAKTQF